MVQPNRVKLPHSPIEPADFRAIMGRFATGVTIISYWRGDTPAGITANAFLSVSMDPPLVLISVRKSSQFLRHMALGDYYGVNFLTEHQQDLSSHFGGRSIAGLQAQFNESFPAPLVEGCLAYLVARVVDIHPAGDHVLYIAQVEHLRRGIEAKPLIFYSGAYKQIHTHNPELWDFADGW